MSDHAGCCDVPTEREWPPSGHRAPAPAPRPPAAAQQLLSSAAPPPRGGGSPLAPGASGVPPPPNRWPPVRRTAGPSGRYAALEARDCIRGRRPMRDRSGGEHSPQELASAPGPGLVRELRHASTAARRCRQRPSPAPREPVSRAWRPVLALNHSEGIAVYQRQPLAGSLASTLAAMRPPARAPPVLRARQHLGRRPPGPRCFQQVVFQWLLASEHSGVPGWWAKDRRLAAEIGQASEDGPPLRTLGPKCRCSSDSASGCLRNQSSPHRPGPAPAGDGGGGRQAWRVTVGVVVPLGGRSCCPVGGGVGSG